MQNFNIVKKIDVDNTFRNQSILNRFDMSVDHAELKLSGIIDIDHDWDIGIICGMSGTGKTTIAENILGGVSKKKSYSKTKSVIDSMPKNKSIEEILCAFNDVGFSTPPSYIKPYSVLSTGEKMRVDIARLLLSDNDFIVFDEFTSVVDRKVAMVMCRAIVNAIKKNKKKFVAVTCHSDVIQWLRPDWVFNTDTMLQDNIRGQLQQKKIRVAIHEEKGKWDIFRRYHYMNSEIHKSSTQYVAYIDNDPVGFISYLHMPHPKRVNIKKIHRLVVLPEYQGIGIGKNILKYVADLIVAKKFYCYIATSNPKICKSLVKSKDWILKRKSRTMKAKTNNSRCSVNKFSSKKYTMSFMYRPNYEN